MSEDGAEASDTKPFRILTVCTGNICRSPMAERLLQSGLDERFPGQFVVGSAGTRALVGYPIDPRVSGLIRVLGGTAGNFASRQLTLQIVQQQDLVLALTREHRSQVVEMMPAMLRKVFTLREFARLLGRVHVDESLSGADRWSAAIPNALRARSAEAGATENSDIQDPYRRSDAIHNLVARQISESIATMIAYTG